MTRPKRGPSGRQGRHDRARAPEQSHCKALVGSGDVLPGGGREKLEINLWTVGVRLTCLKFRNVALRPGRGSPVRARRYGAENAAVSMEV